MKRNNRSKADRLDDILDENILNGDMSEDELDELLNGNESDDEERDDAPNHEVSEDGSDEISDEENSEDGTDDTSDEVNSEEELADTFDDEESDISGGEISEEELADLLRDEDSEEESDEEDSDDEEDVSYIEEDDDETDDEMDERFTHKTLSARRTNRSEEKSSVGLLLGIAWILFAVLCAVYVYVFFIKKPQDVPGKNNTVKLEIPDGANYRLCDIDEINQLVSDFLTARANCDQKVLQSLVTDPSQFDDMTGLEMIFTDYARGYQNTTCYIVDGFDENGYLVIELSNLRLVDIKSQPLDVMSFYIVRLGDGSYKIDNSPHSTEVETYISNVTATQDIQDIYIHVKEQNDYLLQTDTAFADLYHRIME